MFPSSILGCSSCHDPHGNESFRLLNGAHAVQAGAHTFANPAPSVTGISVGTNAAETPTNHNAYLNGYSEWCANCHGNFHASAQMRHPSGEAIGGTIAQTYNLYNGTGASVPGSQATAYLPAVPFEDLSNTITSTVGPSASSEVSCVSCHRAHSTSSPDAGRWDFNVTVLEEDGLESGSYPIPNPYVALTADQRSLCNKCHHKDVNDVLNP
jgi:cytochrome c553